VNISFVSDAIYPYNKGGKEKRLYELSTRLSRTGHDVHIYTMHWWQTPEPSRQEHGVQLHAICPLYPLYRGDKRSLKEGILYGLACLKLLRVPFEVLDVDHMPFFPVYSCWLVCALRRKKLYGTWHEALSPRDWVNYMGVAGYVAAIIERISVHLPHTVTAASSHTQRLLGQQLNRKRRVRLVASGIDTKTIAQLQPAAVRCDVLYTGRLVKDKNVAVLIDAVAILAQAEPSVRCIVIGQGIEHDRLQAQIKQLGVERQVQLLGPLPEATEVYSYMKAAKVFCLPSVREGFGIVALEALACGTPVVTIDSPSNASKDLVEEGENGSVVALDKHALAGALRHWITRARPDGLPESVRSYDWNTLAQTQAEVYGT
jgi:glycosyltransferase involved in cell wall biosynthesis